MPQHTARWFHAIRLALFCLLLAGGLSHAAESPRDWRRRGSDKTLNAVYITVKDGKVVIARSSDGAQAPVDFDDLSDADQAYVIGARQRELAAASGVAVAPATAPAAAPVPAPIAAPAPAAPAPAPVQQTRTEDALSPSDAMDMADSDGYDDMDDGDSMTEEEFDAFLAENGLRGSSPIHINWVLVTVLGIMNIPMYLLWGKLFFGDFGGFLTSLRFTLTPDIVSLFRGEYGEDRWEQSKFAFWIIVCIVCVIAEYKIFTLAYTKIFG